MPCKVERVLVEPKVTTEDPAAVLSGGEVPVPSQQQHHDFRELEHDLKGGPSDGPVPIERFEQ